jgi:preprotein translocase subunit SecA
MFKKLFNAFKTESLNANLEPNTDFYGLVEGINQFNFRSYSELQLKSHIREYKARFFIWLSEIQKGSNNSNLIEKGNFNLLLRDLLIGDLFIRDFLIESYAITKEICRRILNLEPYDSQLLTAIALHFGKITELPTGEGKTLAAVFPVILNALAGSGVHIFTFNDYLAKRDATWMKVIYETWGLKVDYVQEWMDNKRRKAAYNADITYVTSKEAGFDYLRDTLVYSEEELVHRPFSFVIVDEADSILIDEARVPLVIAGNIANIHKIDKHLVDIVSRLQEGIDFLTDENRRNVFLTDNGINKLENNLQCGNLYDNNVELLTAINNLLHAKTLLKRDIDYIIRNDQIEIIDEFTGRVADKRKWHDGLQMAIEAIEGINCTQNSRILGKITLQNFVSLYPRIGGMTATAKSSEDEFLEAYNRAVYVVKPNKKCIRIDYEDAIYTHKNTKYIAIVEDIVTVHHSGRPILIGTANIEESEMLAELLKRRNINYVVLNAKNDDEEAEIIARAGRLGTVTVSTNMAGRGVDIKLGEGDDSTQKQKVIALGGLYVIGTHKNECLRIDNQLRGRAARQGDPGASRFYVSLDDDLLNRFGLDNVLPKKYKGLVQKEQISDSKLNSLVNHIQRVVNGQNFDIRTTLGKYSLLLEYQRRILSKKRTELLCEQSQSLLELKNPNEYEQLCESYGKQRVAEIERKVSLHCIDESWYDFLEHCESLREGIELVSASKKVPLDEYRKLVIEEFDNLYRNLEEQILSSLENTDFSMDDNALINNGLHTPASTWTYIINDNIKVKRFSLFKF